MERNKAKKPKYKLVFRFDSPLMKIAVVVLLVLCILTFAALHFILTAEQERLADMRQQAALLEQQKQNLEDKIGALGTQESVKDIAGDELGLADPNNKDMIVDKQ